MNRLLDSLIAEWRRCGGDKCRTRKCKRCQRFNAYTGRQAA